MPPRVSHARSVYQLKVTLQNTKPPLWRRIQVRASIDLPLLHEMIQVAMGRTGLSTNW